MGWTIPVRRILDSLVSGLEKLFCHNHAWAFLGGYYSVPPPQEEDDPALKRLLVDLIRENEQKVFKERLQFWESWWAQQQSQRI